MKTPDTPPPSAASINSQEPLKTPYAPHLSCHCTALDRRAWKRYYGDTPCDGSFCAYRREAYEQLLATTTPQSQMLS